MTMNRTAEFTVHRGVGERIDVTVPYRARKGGYRGRYEIEVPVAPGRTTNVSVGWVVRDEKAGPWRAFMPRNNGTFTGRCVIEADTLRAACEELLWEVARELPYTGKLAEWIEACND